MAKEIFSSIFFLHQFYICLPHASWLHVFSHTQSVQTLKLFWYCVGYVMLSDRKYENPGVKHEMWWQKESYSHVHHPLVTWLNSKKSSFCCEHVRKTPDSICFSKSTFGRTSFISPSSLLLLSLLENSGIAAVCMVGGKHIWPVHTRFEHCFE